MQEEIIDIYESIFDEIIESSFDYSTIKEVISEWVEKNLVLPSEASRIAGNYSYDNSPYVREIINRMHPSDPTRQIAIMKGTQCGITTGFVIPVMMYFIVNSPCNMLFTSKDKDIAKRTMRTKFDLFMNKSGFDKLIRSNNVKAGSKRTGDTDYLKEYAGGSTVVESTQNIQNIREHAAKIILVDEFDTAKAEDKKEGSMRATLEGRQTSYGNLAKIAYISTPTTTQTSNIYKAYLEGDQRKWNWECPKCSEFNPVEFQIKLKDGSYAGLVWKLDKKKDLIEDSIRYKFPCCGHEIEFKEKYDINIRGKFEPTSKPTEPNLTSYNLNSLILGPGFITWEKIVRDFLKACPPGRPVNIGLLMAFNFTHLGLPFEEKGEVPKIMNIVSNSRGYDIGLIPDELCEKDGNGEIKLITLAVDLGGIMNDDIEDVRADWEVLAHSSTGATYSIDQGSIGTFKRSRTRSKDEIERDVDRKRWTYHHGQENSVWPELDKIAERVYSSQKGDNYMTSIVIVDTGYFTSLASQYVNEFNLDNCYCYGIKGFAEKDYYKLSQDKSKAKKSTQIKNQYNLNVELLKDELANNMKLKLSYDGSQQPGFMNFPTPSMGKYGVDTFFKHFEAEERKEIKENGEVVGFRWKKKYDSIENHFFDVRIYGLAAVYILLEEWRRADTKKYKNIDWAMFVELN